MRTSDAAFGERMAQSFEPAQIPAIVRRRAPCDQTGIGIGISFPFVEEDGRLRFATTVAPEDVVRRISPYDLVENALQMTMRPFGALQRVAEVTRPGTLGIYGACALQTVTGLRYVHDRSDLDLVVCGETITGLRRMNSVLPELEREFGSTIDVEVILACGGGVKLKELCGRQKTVLVKSISAVEIINKSKAIETLLSNETAASPHGVMPEI